MYSYSTPSCPARILIVPPPTLFYQIPCVTLLYKKFILLYLKVTIGDDLGLKNAVKLYTDSEILILVGYST